MHLSDAVRNPSFSVCWVYIVQNTKRHHQSLLQISERQFVILMKACILRIRRCYKSLWNKGRTSIQGQALHVRSARQTARTAKCPGCFASRCSVQGSASLALPQQLSQHTLQRKQSAGADHSHRKAWKSISLSRPSTENVGGLFLSQFSFFKSLCRSRA